MPTRTAPVSRRALVGVVVALALFALPGAASAESTEIDLTPHMNNVGIQHAPTQSANFDGGGYSYSAAALLLGDPVDGYPGVESGDTLQAGDFTFTWNDRPPGAVDNVMATGQTIAVPPTPGATRLGFLGSATGGSATGTLTLTYSFLDGEGVERQETAEAELGFTDWTRGLLGDDPLRDNEEVVLKTRFRSTAGEPFFFTQPHVFLVTLPLDETMTLESVSLPRTTQIHLFGMAIA